ncbi:MAG TPA: hypothetical protein VJ715_13760 [Pyrinomonadaceae bacterium]|nr:hypothetical protein [Pyrinomonadaceae bacterium]
MKARNVFKQFTAAGLIFAAAMLSACASNTASSNGNSNATAAAGNSAPSGAGETKARETSPVTVTIDDLFAETGASSASSVMEKYMGRKMTVTGGVLYEIESDSSKVGKGQNPDFGTESSSPQYFVTCKGKPPAYSPEMADDVARWRQSGQAQPFTVTGDFKEAGSYNNKHWVILSPCSMVKADRR